VALGEEKIKSLLSVLESIPDPSTAQHKVYLYISKLSSFLTENTTRLHYKHQPVNVDSYETHNLPSVGKICYRLKQVVGTRYSLQLGLLALPEWMQTSVADDMNEQQILCYFIDRFRKIKNLNQKKDLK
jgi:hypothetical protein